MGTRPVYRTIVVVDIEQFGRLDRDDSERVELRRDLRTLLVAALTAEGVAASQWSATSTGDGLLVLVDPSIETACVVRAVVERFAQGLTVRNRSVHELAWLRVRAVVHAAHLLLDTHDPIGEQVNLAFRLLDAGVLRTWLRRVPGPLVVALSAVVYQQIAQCPPLGSTPSFSGPVAIAVKETSAQAWIHPAADGLPPVEGWAGSAFEHDLKPSARGLTRGAKRGAKRRARGGSDHQGGAASRLHHAAEGLAEAIRQQWADEAAVRRLHRPEPIRVRWSTTGRAVAAHPAAVLGDSVGGRPLRLRLRGRVGDVVGAFTRLPKRQLVVLGEPGAGKTVLAILLTLGLLDHRRRYGGPVPVLLSAASWNPDAEHLDTWIARRLTEDYPALTADDAYGRAAAARLVSSGRVLPVLDGLDELSPALHPTAIDAIDRAASDGRPFAVTCRSAEYQTAVARGGRVLATAAVIEIEPVAVGDAIAFLSAGMPPGDTRWDPVHAHLRAHDDGPLASALSTPLMVSLARAAYADPDTDPAELADPERFPERAAIEDHLLDAFIPASFSRRPPGPASAPLPVKAVRRGPEDALRWLAFLAVHLDDMGTYDLAWWRLHQAVPRAVTGVVFGFLTGLVTGLGVGLAGLAAGLLAGPVAVVATAAVTGLLAGLVFGLVAGLVWRSQKTPGLATVRRRGWLRELGGSLRDRLVFGFVIGLVVVVVAGLVVGVAAGAALGLGAGLVAMLAAGLADSLKAPPDELGSLSPRSVLRGDRAMSLARALGQGLGLGLGVGLMVRVAFGLAAGLVSGLAGVLGAAIAGGVDSTWGVFLVVRVWLAVRGRLPLRLMRFLDDAHRRGVLRQAGAVYQFRHARLQDRLASRRVVTARRGVRPSGAARSL